MTPAHSRTPGMRESIRAAMVKGPVHEPKAGTASFEFRFAASDPVFAGHFPGQPLLPGVFQIEMTRVAAESVLGNALDIREIVRAKFLRPILPEEIIRLCLKFNEESSIIHARATLVAGGQSAGEAALKLCRSL
jgi:3-hydroxymyristoyl/3-hydroxydecanoyl-(acyl carrier protein) dehydratase